jgi:hypothetical protein
MANNAYIPAGGDVIHQHLTRIARERNVTVELIRRVLSRCIEEILVCYSICFDHKSKNVGESFNKRLLKIKDFLQTNLIVDSGGFQINTGKYNFDTALRLYDSYYDFLLTYPNSYSRAFVLDLAPGPNSKVFDSYDQVEDINNKSYDVASKIPNSIFVFHMFSKEQEQIWSRLLDKHFNNFKYFSIGGLASGRNSTSKIVSYSVAIYKTLKKCIETGTKELNFHILGGGIPWYLCMFELIKKHVKTVHDIDINFTFDSTGYVKEIKKDRQFLHFDNVSNELEQINFKSKNLSVRVGNKGTIQTVLFNLIGSFYGAQTSLGPLYKENGSIDDTYSGLLFLMYFEQYGRIQDYIRNQVETIYINYREKNYDEFFTGLYDLSRRFHKDNKLSTRRIVESNEVLTALNLISKMDDGYYYYICEKNFSSIEHISTPLLSL